MSFARVNGLNSGWMKIELALTSMLIENPSIVIEPGMVMSTVIGFTAALRGSTGTGTTGRGATGSGATGKGATGSRGFTPPIPTVRLGPLFKLYGIEKTAV